MSYDSKIIKQEQDQRTYENAAEARRVINTDSSGNVISSSNPLPTTSADYTLQLDEAAGSITYVGDAVIGSATSAAVWRIKRLDESGSPELIIKWCEGTSDFTKIWDNRASYTYT